MDSIEDHPVSSSTVVVTSSPELLSPGGKSRYGRTRRPKISRDFYNIDDVVIDEKPAPRLSPVKCPRIKPQSPIITREVPFEIKDEFTKLDDLGMKVANNFKSNIHRGLDDTIKERKFFKSTPENKMDVPNVVDVTKVFKLISAKPAVVSDMCEAKITPKSALKTYSNKRKHLHDSDSFIVESFGLPDEPIIPLKNPRAIERDMKIDVDLNCEVDVNLVNPWALEDFDPEPLYASEPITLDEIQFSRGGMVDLYSYDKLMNENNHVFDAASDCQDYINFEKSRIPSLVDRANVKTKSERKQLNEVKLTSLNTDNIRIQDKISKKKVFSRKLKKGIKNNKDESVVSEIKVFNKKLSPLTKKARISHSPLRILRSNRDNNNIELKKDNSLSTSSLDNSDNPIVHENELQTSFKTKKVINPFKAVCTSQVRVILNPLACIQKQLENKNLVPNPFKIKAESKKSKIRSKKKLVAPKLIDHLPGVFNGIKHRAYKKQPPQKVIKEKVTMENMEVDLKNVKQEPIDFQVGDLTWAKIGNHSYWPCMITQEPESGQHTKFIPHRSQPLYHVRFFGDRGRRSWVSAQYIMLFYGRDDLEKIAKFLREQNNVKASFIKEAYRVKPAKLSKWQMGVDEAELLKCKSIDERLNYFFDLFASKREKQQQMKEFEIKKEVLDDFNMEEGHVATKKRGRVSNNVESSKKSKRDSQELISEHTIKEETLETNFPELKEEIKQETKDGKKKPIVKIESPTKKLIKDAESIQKGSVEKLISPGSQKRIGKKNQSNEESDVSKKTGRKSHSKDEIIEAILSPNKTTKVLKKLETNEKKKEPETSAKKKQAPDENLSPPDQTELLKEDTPSKTNQKPEFRKKFLKKEEFSDVSIEARKKLRNFPVKPETCETPQEAPKESPKRIEEPSQQGAEEKELKIRNKRHQIPGEYSNSDTDSKFSDNSSVPTSLESQAALYRRNNIFRGIPKEKVCQSCEKGGEVFKCKGPCSGVYHYNCAMNRTSDDENEDPAKEVKVGEGGKDENRQSLDGDQNTVEIISVNSKKPLPNLSDSPNFKGMSLAEKIDFRMKEIMKKFDYQSVYAESTDSSSEEFIVEETFEKLKNQSKLSLTVTNKPSKKEVPIIKHVTADNISYICVTNEKPKQKEESEILKESLKHFKCILCTTSQTSRCFVCNKNQSKIGSSFRQKCSLFQCGKYYHRECLKQWPQTQWSLIQSTKDKKSDAKYDTFVCPRHVCHTCISDDPRAANSRCTSDKVVKCLRCPATYHSSNYCVPAGSHILSTSQIVCPRHFSNQKQKRRMQQTINTNWCFICSKGGNLICCETCPTSVHVECLPGDLNEDDTFYCEDCQSGRLPLYDEIVWVKLGTFRWWPALILFPNEIPDNVRNKVHNRGEFVVKFYGTYDHYWVGRGRTFLFQEGDKGHSNSIRKRVDNAFVKAIEEAAAAHQLKKQFKLNKVAEKNGTWKPPPYIKIKVNKPVGNVRLFDGNTSNTTSCDCDPNQPHPCGPDSDCLNRLLLTECNPEVCPAGDRCNNQCFEKREYPPLVPHHTQVRGWGLKTLAPIRKGQFVIEYVGEIIDEQEYQRRIAKMHEQKEENYYFLTIDKDRTLDAGPKGNVARFMNHSCQPNCETQKWTVNGDTRVGLFANCDIPADTELTFNYNLECIGKEKKICKCGAPNCSGFIGVKVKPEVPLKKPSKPKKKKTPPPEVVDNQNPCFICGKTGDVGACNNKICTKYYHLGCVGLPAWPEGGKWVCQWHNCNICSKRTIRCCVKCVNSYCPPHSEGNVRYDKLLGFVCFEHDPTKETTTLQTSTIPNAKSDVTTEEGAVTSTTPEDLDDDLESVSLAIRLNNCVTSTPLKKSKEESSLDESAVSSVTTPDMKSQKKKRKKKAKRKRTTKVETKSRAKNTANLVNPVQNEVKLSKFTPVKYLRTSRSSTKIATRPDPEKSLPIRKRNRLRCGNTL